MQKQIKKFWNNQKIVSEFRNAPVKDYWYEYFALVANPNENKVLDVGCGGGRYTEMLCKMGFQVSAFDLHEGMVRATRERMNSRETVNKTGPTIVLGDMTEIPFKSNQFDFVLSNGVFHNARSIKDLKKAIFEVGRVLKDNGSLCLNMFYCGGDNTKLVKRTKSIFITQDETPMVLLDLISLLDLFKGCGFIPSSDVITYTREMEVGVRNVMRTTFKNLS